MGMVVSKLRYLTGGLFFYDYQHNQSPLKVKDWKRLEYGGAVRGMAIVTAIQSEEKLIKIYVNDFFSDFFSVGDVFCFRGKSVIIEKKHQLRDPLSAYSVNSLSKYTQIKKRRSLSLSEKEEIDDKKRRLNFLYKHF